MTIKAAIFDMDGLLINSEPLWRKAEMEVFKEVSVFLTESDCESTAGLRIDEVIEHWYQLRGWTEKEGTTRLDIEHKVVSRLIQLVEEQGEALPGVPEIFRIFKERQIPMAIASSSKYDIINAVTKKLDIRSYFDLIYSAEDEEYGKPHPGIFITTAKKMGVSPLDCIVFEDSFNGILSGLAARMFVVAVPEGDNLHKPKFDIAHHKIRSLVEFTSDTLDGLIRP